MKREGKNNLFFKEKLNKNILSIGQIPKSPKAQTTIFIIIAIILVFAIISIFISKPDILDIKTLTINSQVRPLHSFIQSCVEQTSINAINHIADNGGYYIPPNKSLFNGIPIYFDKGEVNTISLQQVELELSKYMNEMLFFCTKNFINFPDFNIKQEKIKTTTKIQKGKVIFNINYPLSISKDEKSYTFTDFESQVNVRLLAVHTASLEITQDQIEFPNEICITCIEDTSINNEIIVKMRDFQESVIFSIIDLNSQINENDLTFYFANNY